MSILLDGLTIHEVTMAENGIYMITDEEGEETYRANDWGPDYDGSYYNHMVNVQTDLYVWPIKPSVYHSKDYTNQVWFFDPSKYRPVFRNALKEYRNSVYSQPITVNGVTANNDNHERTLITDLIATMQSGGEEVEELWIQPDNTEVMATISDFQSILLQGGTVRRNAFKAFGHVMNTYDNVAPYDNYEDGIEEFNEKFEELMGV